MTEQLEKKVQQAIKLLQTAYKSAIRGGNTLNDSELKIEVAYSGGKDSDVILTLARMAEIPIRPIYKNTTIDPPGTIKHALENGVEMVRPKETFFQLIAKKGYPSRQRRFCCEVLKEYKIEDNAIQGVRRSESTRRSKRYNEDEPIVCRIYGGNKKNHVNVILPILNWTDKDIEEFINEYHVKCHPLYYDEQGKFHVERRLGCTGCPLAHDHGLKEFKANPKMVRAWLRAGKKWWDKHREGGLTHTQHLFGNVYNLFYYNVFCNSYKEYEQRKNSMFGERDFKKEMEDYFGIDLTID